MFFGRNERDGKCYDVLNKYPMRAFTNFYRKGQ